MWNCFPKYLSQSIWIYIYFFSNNDSKRSFRPILLSLLSSKNFVQFDTVLGNTLLLLFLRIIKKSSSWLIQGTGILHYVNNPIFYSIETTVVSNTGKVVYERPINLHRFNEGFCFSNFFVLMCFLCLTCKYQHIFHNISTVCCKIH